MVALVRAEQAHELGLALLPGALAKADVAPDESAVAREDVRARHAGHFVARSEPAFRVVQDRKVRRRLLQEALRLALLPVDVHTDDDQPARAVLRLHLVEPRKGLPARSAP